MSCSKIIAIASCILGNIGIALGPPSVTTAREVGQQEAEQYRAWVGTRVEKWTRTPDAKGRWPSDGSPWAPFDLARMFQESDLVIECRVRPHTNLREDGSIEYHPLLVQVEEVSAVHKGTLATGTEEWKRVRQLAMSVLVDELHTGHWGYARLASAKPYLLFLHDVDEAERRARGYAGLPGRLLRINRVWHGAVALHDGMPPGQAGSYCAVRSIPYRAIGVFWQDALAAVKDVSLVSRSKVSQKRLSALKHKAKMHDTLAKAAMAGNPDEAKSVLGAVPESLVGEFEAILTYRAFLAEREAKAREQHVAHLQLLAALAGDVAKTASLQSVSTTRPSRPPGTSEGEGE